MPSRREGGQRLAACFGSQVLLNLPRQRAGCVHRFAEFGLGHAIGAEMLLILTAVDRVAINFGRPDQQFLSRISVSDARRYLAEKHFPDGSMGPKIEAAVQFIEGGGKKVLITSIEKAEAALNQKDGTWILPD